MRILAIVVVLGVLAGLGIVYSGVYSVAATDPHSAFTKWLFETTMEHSVKRRAENIAVPELSGADRIDVGFSNYEEMCAQCHSPPEEPISDLAKGLNPKPPDLAESAKQLSAAEIFWIVKNGIKMTGMPAWGPTHTDEELWSVVAFVRQLPHMTSDQYEKLKAAMKSEGEASH
jgi:mono/diheme cytochrome c family protein